MMNILKKQALADIDIAYGDMIQGYFNQLSDYPEDSTEYKQAWEYLTSPLDELVNELYRYVIRYGKEESRFAGEDFIKKSIKASLLEDDEFEFHGINLKGGVSA